MLIPSKTPRFDDKHGGGCPVLLVEQNAFSFIAIQGILAQYGLAVDHALCFDKAFNMMKERLKQSRTSYKLVLFDCTTIEDSDIKEAEIMKYSQAIQVLKKKLAVQIVNNTVDVS